MSVGGGSLDPWQRRQEGDEGDRDEEGDRDGGPDRTASDPGTWETHPVTPDRFEDFADVINPNRRADSCWCLSHRIRAKEIEELGRGSREQAMRALCEREHPPGVVTYLDGTPVGWCNIGPRSEIRGSCTPGSSSRPTTCRCGASCASSSAEVTAAKA